MKRNDYYQYLSDISQYNWHKVFIKCVPDNYLEVTDNAFYYPKDFQDGIKVNKTSTGHPDAVQMLYTDESVNYYPTYPSNNTNMYNISFGRMNERMLFTETIKILIPVAFQPALSSGAGDIVRLRNHKNNADWNYRA